MKRLLSNVLTTIVVATVGVISASAQGWEDITTSTLTNPSFSNDGNGWTKTNISGWNNESAVMVGESFHQSGWGLNRPNYELSQTITLGVGKYYLTGNAFHRGSGEGYLFATISGTDNKTALPLVGGQFSADIDNMKNAGKAFVGNMYLSIVEFEVTAANTSVTIGYKGTATADYDWFIGGPLKLYKAQNVISSTYPYDFTNTIARTNSTFGASGRYDGAQVYIHEKYQGSAFGAGNVMSTTYSNLNNGEYEVVVFAQGNCAWGASSVPSTAPQVFANTISQNATCVVQNSCANVPEYTLSGVRVSDGTMSVGFRNTAEGGNWYLFNVKSLKMTTPAIDYVATELPTGNMTANTWYYFDILTNGDYALTTTTLSNISYTTDGTQLTTSATTSTWSSSPQTLTAGRYYVKSSSAQTLTVTAQAYTYEVGSATIDKTYVQPGNTVTVTYVNAVTNSGEALTINTNGVTFNGVALTNPQTTANGFTFEIPSGLAAGTAFTLSIPAGAVGYTNGNTFNTAETFTINTPVVFDGTYFFKIENNGGLKGQYLSRGKNWGTHITADKYGLPIKVATDSQNRTTLKPADTDRFLRMDNENGYNCWADNTTNDDKAKFNLVAANGHFMIHAITTRENDYFKYNDGDVNEEQTKLYADSQTNGVPIEFSAETPAAHATVMTGMKNSQAATAATAAYTDNSTTYASLNGVSTVAALETAVAALDNFVVVGGAAPSTVSEKYQGAQPGGDNSGPEIVYSSTLTVPDPGLYRFSMQAFYRAASNARTQAIHTDGVDFPPVVLFFGDSETQIKSLYDENGGSSAYVSGNDAQYNGMYYANNMDAALMMFQEGKYKNDVWFYAPEAGTYTYGVKYMGFANANMQWFIYSPEAVTVTYYGTGTITTANGIVTVLGNISSVDINNALTSDIAVLDIEKAVGLNDDLIDNYNNENLLIYAKSTTQVENRINVIANGTCANLKLRKSNSPFFVPKAFTATNAEYRVVSNDLAGDQFATLMIPFESDVPADRAFTLDQGINTLGGEVKATAITTVLANSPVLITSEGYFTGTNVSIPVIAKDETFTSGELIGVYSTTQAPVGSYVLQNHTSSPNGVAFYLVNDVQPNVGPFRAYIKGTSSSAKPRALFVNFGDGQTGIGTLHEDGTVMMDGAEYFTVGGARLANPQKGLNVVKYSDGTVKKIFVK